MEAVNSSAASGTAREMGIPRQELPPRMPWTLAAVTLAVVSVYLWVWTATGADGWVMGASAASLGLLMGAWGAHAIDDSKFRWPRKLHPQLPSSRTTGVAVAACTAVLAGVSVTVWGAAALGWALAVPLFVAGAWIDLRTKRIPAAMCWGPAIAAVPGVVLTVNAWLTGGCAAVCGPFTDVPTGAWFLAGFMVLSGLFLPAILSGASLIFPAGIGAGDCRLVWTAWLATFPWATNMTLMVMFLAAVVLQVAVHVTVAVRRPDASRQLPFGPALVAGFVIAAAVTGPM